MRFTKLLYFFGAIFLLTSTTIRSQNTVIDSLEQELKIHVQQDTIRVNILDRLSFLYYRKDIAKANTYIAQAEVLSDTLGFKKGKANAIYMRGVVAMMQANFEDGINHFEHAAQIYKDNDLEKKTAGCYNGIGIIYYKQSDYDKALIYYKKALEIDEAFGVERNIPNYITNIGNIYMKTGKYPEAITNFKKGLALYTERDYSLGISVSLKSLAVIYYNQGNYPLALDYNTEALSLAEKIQDSAGISRSLNNISLIYKKQERYDKALELLERSLRILKHRKNDAGVAAVKNNIASIYIKTKAYPMAIDYLKASLVLNRNTDSKSQLSECLNNLGHVYQLLKKYNEAHAYFEEAKTINIDIDNQEGLCVSHFGLANNYVDQKQYSKALPHALKSLEIANQLKLLDDQSKAYQLLSEIYKHKGNYQKALVSHQQFKTLNDSIFNKENIEKITQLEYEYKYKRELDAANDRELQLTKTVKTTSEHLEQSQQNLFLGIIGFLVTALILGGIIFWLKLRNEKSKTQNIAIEQKLLRSQMTPHFIFNSLSVLQGMILNKEDKKSVYYLSKFSKLLRITLENSRDKLVPLQQELEAVNNYLELQNLEENTSYDYTILVDDTIDTSQFKIPPMLIQPFIENAIEHAFNIQSTSKKIDVRLKYVDAVLICTIVDNGIGIDEQNGLKKKNKTSLATTITSERLKMLSKDFKIKGSVCIEDRRKYNEKGTIVTLKIPYKITEAS